ncbi:hypothetical protein MQH10_19190, partial [Phenylobacterium aquaticum]|nr:hypothetical protein [Phenylobacterium aquaticum]
GGMGGPGGGMAGTTGGGMGGHGGMGGPGGGMDGEGPGGGDSPRRATSSRNFSRLEGAARYSLINEPQPVRGADLNLDWKVTAEEWAKAPAAASPCSIPRTRASSPSPICRRPAAEAPRGRREKAACSNANRPASNSKAFTNPG